MPRPDDPASPLGELLRRHAAGHPDARNALLVHSLDRFKLIAGRMLGQFPDVSEGPTDIAHRLVLRLISSLGKLTFDQPSDFLRLATWHLRRVLLDLARKRRPVTLPAADRFAPDPLADQPVTTDDPLKLAQWADFHAAVRQLNPKLRTVFGLIFYQGLRQDEVARLLGRSEKTVRRRWLEAKLALVNRFGDDLPF